MRNYVLAISIIVFALCAMAAIIVRFSPSQNERHLHQQAKQLEQKGELAKAAVLYEKSLSGNLPPSERAALLSNLSGLYYRQSNLMKARSYLQDALALYPVPAFSFQLALYDYEQDKFKAASRHLKDVYRDNPSYPGLQKLSSILLAEQDAEKHLQVFESAHFILKARREETALAPQILNLLEESRGKLANIYPFPLHEKSVVKILDDFTFESLIGKPVQTTSAVSINGKLFIRSPRLKGIGESMKQIVVHEYVHLLFHRLLPESEPVWLHEGIAAYLSGEFLNEENARALQKAVRGKTVFPLRILRASWKEIPASSRTLAYTQSARFIDFLVSTYSWDNLYHFIFSLSAGNDEALAFSEVFEITPEAAQEKFLTWLSQK